MRGVNWNSTNICLPIGNNKPIVWNYLTSFKNKVIVENDNRVKNTKQNALICVRI